MEVEAIQRFQGGLVLVSHDFCLIDQVLPTLAQGSEDRG